MRSSLAVCGALLTALLLTACGGGGGDGPTPEEEVKATVVRALETDQADTFCHKYASKGFLRRVYDGDVKECVTASGTVPKVGGKVEATKAIVRADEKQAQVRVDIEGGSLDGTDGQVEMVKEGTWKVDDYADDFIRSSFLAAIRTTDEGAVSTPEMKACFTRGVKRLPAAEIRRITDASNAEEEKKERKVFLELAENCPASALAEYGARTLTEGLVNNGNHKPGYVTCLHKEIKFLLEVTGITTELLKEHPGFAATAALEGITEGAKKNCGG